MDQRLRKLNGVWKRVQDLPEEAAKPLSTGAAAVANPDFFEAATAPASPAVPAPAAAKAPGARPRSGVFVVYQHDPRAQTAVREFCTKLGFEVAEIAVDAQPDISIAGQLDQHPHLDFGLILSRAETPPTPFELGYCVGRLGLKRVFVLSATDDKLSVDEHGLLHIPLDPADGWQLHLARQLKRAGLEIDLNRVV